MTAVENQAGPTAENPSPEAGGEAGISAEKQAQKEAKAAQKKAEKEAKKLKALEKQKKQDADKEAAAANAGKKAEAKAAAKAKADAKAAAVQAKIDQAVATPSGQKKDVSCDPPDSYHPKCVLICCSCVGGAFWRCLSACAARIQAIQGVTRRLQKCIIIAI